MTISKETEVVAYVGFIIILTMLVISAIYSFQYKPVTSSIQTDDKSKIVHIGEYERAAITAQQDFRSKEGKNPLLLNQKLTSAARNKARLLCETDVWSHTPKEGRVWEQEIIDSGYSYEFAGENLAKGYDEPERFVEAWIASPTHKANLLGDFKDVGVAFNQCDNKKYLVMEYGR